MLTAPRTPPTRKAAVMMLRTRAFHRENRRWRSQWPTITPRSVTMPVTWVVRIASP
jgi:hypothetical protein